MDMTLEIAELRVQAESMMTDRVVITRASSPSGTPVLDPITGTYPEVAPAEVYVGVASLRVIGTVVKLQPSAGDTVTVLDAILSIPVSGPTLRIGDVVLFTASRFGPALVGAVYTVSSLLPSSHVTKQRVSVVAAAD